MSDTVEALCPKLAALNGAGLLNPAQQDVFLRCREVKIQPGEDFDDLTDDDRNALGNMTSTQTSSMSRATVELAGPQMATVAGRLQALRVGTVGGLALQMNPQETEPILYAGPITGMPQAETASTSGGLWDTGRLGVFINGSFGTGDRDATVNEPGFDYDAYSVTAGVDYRFTNNLVLGTAFGYATSEADIESNGGNVETDGMGVSVYGTYYLDRFFIDFIGLYGKKDYSITRRIGYTIADFTGGPDTVVNQNFSGDPDADEFGFSAGAGYDFQKGGVNFQPFVQLNYLDTDIDGYTERQDNTNTDAGFGLALQVDEQGVTSMTSALGGRVSYPISTNIGVFVPQVSFDWQHEYENDARIIRARFVNGLDDPDNLILIPTDDPDRDYFGFAVGFSMVLPRGISAFVNYDTLLGLDDITSHLVTLGTRFEF